jgi:hypothetical protein
LFLRNKRRNKALAEERRGRGEKAKEDGGIKVTLLNIFAERMWVGEAHRGFLSPCVNGNA